MKTILALAFLATSLTLLCIGLVHAATWEENFAYEKSVRLLSLDMERTCVAAATDRRTMAACKREPL